MIEKNKNIPPLKHQEKKVMYFRNENQLLDQIKNQIELQYSNKDFAVMDADGTLWYEDVNHILLKYQIKKGFDLSDLLSPFYRKGSHRHRRCEIFAQKQSGLKLEDFLIHCRSALKENPLHVFSFQKKLLKYLKEKGIPIIVVTASIKWLVEEAIQIYGLPVDQVLGVENKLNNGVICKEILKPTPTAHSKGEVVFKYNPNIRCLIAGGNTLADRPLLEMAKIPFMVHSAKKENENFQMEKYFRNLALKQNWIVFEKI